MNRFLGTVAICAALLNLPAAAMAQEQWPPPETSAPTALTVNCAGGVYASGAGANLFNLCVSDHGNMISLVYPAGAEHINNVGGPGVIEAYAVCHNTGGPVFWYYDFAAFESGFGPPLVIDPPPFPVQIRRTSTDGRITLDQKFTPNKKRREMLITMTVTNNTGGALTGVQVSRAVDPDMDNDVINDVFDRSADQAWARQTRSMVLSAQTVGTPHSTAVYPGNGSGPCATGSIATPTAPGDNSMRIWYDLGSIAAGKSKKVEFRYNGS